MAHKNQEQLILEIKEATERVRIGALYFHYKHPEKIYIIESVGFFEETEEVCVGYRALYGEGILWVRKIENFLEEVEVGGKKVKRFTLVK